jgi:thiazole synthase ThiGH ThiG subunit
VPVMKLFAAQLAREALETNWLKLEIHPDQNT